MTMAVAPQLFHFDDHPVRTAEHDGQPVLVGRDVCTALGISKYRDALAQLDDDERVSVVVDTPGGAQTMTAVTEGGMWSLAFISRSPRVQAFRRWVTHEVLPSIRRTGRYEAAAVPAIPQTYQDALRAAADQADRADAAERMVAELEPVAAAATALAVADGDYSVREAAEMLSRDHGIDTGQKRLFTRLRELGWLDRKGMPYQRTISTGRLALKAGTFEHPHTGEPTLKHQVRVTAKGLLWLHEHWHDAPSTP